jgi:hypothetical protein
MIKASALAGALTLALAVAACSPTGSLSVAAPKDIAAALAVGCPVLATVQTLAPSMNAQQKAAASTLALACPPNPPPTSAIVAVTDLIAAYTTLQPLLK